MRKLGLLFSFLSLGLLLNAQDITVSFPNGGEHWIKNTYAPHNIEWESTGITNFKIEFSDDNGSTWDIIESSYSAGNYYSWHSADVISANCLIRVSDADGLTTDQSDAVFTISDKTIYFAEWNTSEGVIRAELRGDLVPTTVQNFINLSEKGFYTDLIFHRVIPNFMLQDGDPLGTGFGGPGYDFDDEFHPDLRHSFPGVLSMANSGPNTNGSQYFITTVPTTWLDDAHAVFGRVIDGMQVCYDIEELPRDGNNKPLEDVTLTISIVEGVPAMSLQNPSANMKTEQGRLVNIEWDSDFTTDAKIEFSSDNQQSWEVLTDSITACSESFEWLVPEITSTECFIKITSLRNPANFTINSSAFEIRTKPVQLARISFFDNVLPHSENPKNLIMPGKTAKFKVKALNSSGLDLNSLNISIVSKNPDLIVGISVATSPTVSNSNSEWTDSEFSITLPEELPFDGEYILSIYGTDPSLENNFWLGDLVLPVLERFPFMVVDDNDVPDSQGNGNQKLETGETIELIPKISNKSSESIYKVYGKLSSPHDFINVWDEVMGSDGMVYDTAYYKGMQPFSAYSSGNTISGTRDFVFDYTAPASYKTDFVIEMHGYLYDEPGIDWETGGVNMAWGVPFQLNSSSPEVGINSLAYNGLQFSIFDNVSRGSIVLDYNFESLNSSDFQGKVYNIHGQVQNIFVIQNKRGQKVVDCSQLASGVYFIEVSNSKIKRAKKFIVR